MCQACSFSLSTIAQASRTAGIVGSAELVGEVANGKIGEMSIGEKHHQFKTRLSLHTTETPLPSIHGNPKEKSEKQSLHSHATEQLKLHPLRSLKTAHYLTHHAQTRRKIKLENRLYGSPHILPAGNANKEADRLVDADPEKTADRDDSQRYPRRQVRNTRSCNYPK